VVGFLEGGGSKPNPHQLGRLKIAFSSTGGVQGGAPEEVGFSVFWASMKCVLEVYI